MNKYIDAGKEDWNLNGLFDELNQEDNFHAYVKIIINYFTIYNNHDLDKLHDILEQIKKASGNISIKELAKINNYSESAFERYFKKHVGITPKSYSNIIKFNKSFGHIGKKTEMLCSYYDQSHFIKSCKKYTGKTPLELINKTDEITLKHFLKKR